jgi:hypothetical protein
MDINNAAYYQLVGRINHLVQAFGSVWRLMLAVSQDPIRLKLLIDYGPDSVLLSAQQSELNLNEPLIGATPSSIIQVNYPYEIFSTEGKLLYRISHHNGVFGESSLDQQLLLGSETGDVYLLNYQSAAGPATKALLIDRRVQTRSEDRLVPNTGASLTKGDLITFKSRDGVASYPDLTLYFLEQNPMLKPTPASLVGNPRTSKTAFTALPFVFLASRSGWLALGSQDQIIPFVGIEGKGKFRLIPVGSALYYLTMDLDPSYVYQMLRPSYLNQPVENGLTLTVTLSPQDFVNINYDYTKETSIQT